MKAKNFNLRHTLESGQFFRYAEEDGWFACAERERVFRIRQEGHKIYFEGTDKKHVKRLFGLEQDYTGILRKLSKDEKLRHLIDKYKGLRIMERDPWETLISFQCSVMSNMPKIRKNMNLISEKFGEMVGSEKSDEKRFTFPKPGELNDLEMIKQCSTGFRAKWIYAVNNLVDDDYFKRLKKRKYGNAKEELMKLPGVGGKVADCICLFGLGKIEAFPVDVWIARVMEKQFGVGQKDVLIFAKERWGKLAGYAQQFLYHWGRMEKVKCALRL